MMSLMDRWIKEQQSYTIFSLNKGTSLIKADTSTFLVLLLCLSFTCLWNNKWVCRWAEVHSLIYLSLCYLGIRVLKRVLFWYHLWFLGFFLKWHGGALGPLACLNRMLSLKLPSGPSGMALSDCISPGFQWLVFPSHIWKCKGLFWPSKCKACGPMWRYGSSECC